MTNKILKTLLSEADSGKLYHATYKPLLNGIKQYGLGGNPKPRKFWDDSKPGIVYLANDKYEAESYAETSDIVNEDWLDEIIIFEVDKSKLDSTKLSKDHNVIDGNTTFEYKGIIPFSDLKQIK